MTWLMLEAVDTRGRPTVVEVRVRRDTVEFWHSGHCAGVLDRDRLRSWLGAPHLPWRVDEVTLSLMTDRVALLIDGRVPCWPLCERAVRLLEARV